MSHRTFEFCGASFHVALIGPKRRREDSTSYDSRYLEYPGRCDTTITKQTDGTCWLFSACNLVYRLPELRNRIRADILILVSKVVQGRCTHKDSWPDDLRTEYNRINKRGKKRSTLPDKSLIDYGAGSQTGGHSDWLLECMLRVSSSDLYHLKVFFKDQSVDILRNKNPDEILRYLAGKSVSDFAVELGSRTRKSVFMSPHNTILFQQVSVSVLMNNANPDDYMTTTVSIVQLVNALWVLRKQLAERRKQKQTSCRLLGALVGITANMDIIRGPHDISVVFCTRSVDGGPKTDLMHWFDSNMNEVLQIEATDAMSYQQQVDTLHAMFMDNLPTRSYIPGVEIPLIYRVAIVTTPRTETDLVEPIMSMMD